MAILFTAKVRHPRVSGIRAWSPTLIVGCQVAFNDHSQDRRRADRYSIDLDVHYRVIGDGATSARGTGQTINMSSTGVLSTTEQTVRIGSWVELSISWPTKLDNERALKLMVTGKVVRCEAGRMAVEIDRHEFRIEEHPA